jgi:hypothetical protein
MLQFKTMQVTMRHRLAETIEPQVLRGHGWLDHPPTTQVALAADMQTLRDKGRFQMV